MPESAGTAAVGDLRLYVRAGCHLCAEAEAVLAPILREAGRPLQRIDIATDPEAARLFGDRLPVLVCDTRELCWGRLQSGAVRALLGLGPAPARAPFWPLGRRRGDR